MKKKIMLMMELVSLNIKVINDTIELIRDRISRLEDQQKESQNVILYLLKKNKLETFIVSEKEYERNKSFFKGTEFITRINDDEVLLAKKTK